MAHPVESMDVDSDFDNKENSFHRSNVQPCTEKGYEELDVSELNMKLRYSVTPASSPMSKSYTANCVDRSLESGDDSQDITINENANLTRSLNSSLKNDNIIKSLKALPLQSISTEQFNERSTSVLRQLDTTITPDNANVTVTVSGPNDIDDNLSLPSSSSSAIHTPEATTPTKDSPKTDGGSPIMRGLKSVLNMFRSSQSPIPPESEGLVTQDILSPTEVPTNPENSKMVMASTPISSHRKKETSPSKRNSPHKESIVFNEDLEKELLWKDETTILFSQERIPIHKLFFQQTQPTEAKNADKLTNEVVPDVELDSTVEYMDISYNDSLLSKTITGIQADGNKIESNIAGESDSEFVDCETTFTKNESQRIDDKETQANRTQDLTKDMTKNESTSKLKPIILNTTQDILDATLSITPEDIFSDTEIKDKENIKAPEKFHETKVIEQVSENEQETTIHGHEQKIDQAFEITSQAINTESDELNVTKTIENSTTEIGNNSTLKLTDHLNETKTIETCTDIDSKLLELVTAQNIDALHTIENQSKIIDNLNITNTVETKPHIDSKMEEQATAPNLDATHTIEYQPKVVGGQEISVLPSESFDITHTIQKYDIESQILIDQIPQLDIRKSVENILVEDNKSIGQVDVQNTEQIAIANNATGDNLEDRPINPASNMNITYEYNRPSEDKIEDQGNSPVLENNNLITEHEFAIEQVNITKDIIDTPNVNNLTTVEKTCKPNEGIVDGIVPKLDKSITLDDKPLELPADIPLPDEDDIDKELEVRVENTVENYSSVPCHVPRNLEDDMKTKIEDTNSSEVKPTTDREDKIGLPEILPSNITNIEGNVGNKQIVEFLASELTKELHEINTEQNILENVDNDTLPKVIPASDNLTIQDEKTTGELDNSKVIYETHVEPTVNVPNKILESKPELGILMDINESICELKPLPDIINQITTPCQGDNEQPIQDELMEQQTPVELAAIGDNIENITVEIPLATEIITAIDNTPQESGDIKVFEKTKSSDIATEIVADIPSVPKSDAMMIINDAIVNMSIDENIDSSHLQLDITTPTSTPETNNMSPKPNTTLINTPGVALGDTVIEDAQVIDEEVMASENNSPFVCVMAEPETQIDNVDDTKDSFATKTRIVCTPPVSPPISSRGYNFNFDENFDDPFATKAKMQMSPTLDTPNKCAEPKECKQGGKKTIMGEKDVNNRRKSQPGRKRPPPNKNKSNSKFNNSLDTTSGDKPADKIEDESTKIAYEFNKEIKLVANRAESYEKEDKEVQDIIKTANKNIEHKLREALKVQEEIKCIDEKIAATPIVEKSSVDTMEVKNSSSSEQSTYFSAGTSSSESIKSKNVFNLPEIEDMNFNPFATKSKMRQSPLLSQDTENPFATRSNIISSPSIPLNDANITININEAKFTSDDKMETEVMEKDCSTNISNTTTSSKATDERDTTIKEVNTEDEDTAEGPFLEVEDMHDEVKLSEFDTENDMMQFNEVPPPVKAENQDDELFIDAEAFDFLLNQNKSNTVVDSGKESLFLKFDPLFAKRTSSDGVLAALTQIQKRQSTPTKLTKLPEREPISPIAGPSNMNVTHDVDVNTSEYMNDDLNVTVSKPTMAVPPAINPVTPRNKSVTPTRPNRRSVTFTSPAMAVIDRLLSLSANNSPIYDNTFTYVSREQNEANLALTQLRELLAEKEVHVYNLRAESKELKDRLTTMESQVRSLETESHTRLQKINDLNKTLVEKTKINKSMALVVEEYERTIASLISEIEQDKKRHAEERLKLINERDEQTAHLSSMEVSFSDLHSKYEKSKQVIFSCKANEDVYKKSLKEFEENVTKMQNNFDLLKQHATSKLNHANQELEAMNRAHEGEVLKLNAMIKRKELHITSLEETLTQKTKANEELTAICDELINKVG